MRDLKNRLLNADFSWRSLFFAAIISAYGYVFFEWLFIVTKPSFFSAASLLEKVRVGLFTASLLAAGCVLGLAILFACAMLLRAAWVRGLLRNAGALIPAGVLACLALLLIDNFTYTVFHFGIINSAGFTRALYLIVFLLLLGPIFLDLKKNLSGYDAWAARKGRRGWELIALSGLVLASFLLNYERPEVSATDFDPAQAGRGRLPHILLITADGLNAVNTSIYGYERDTTPVLAELARSSLVAENAFNNSGNTMGSTLSIYTSKYPTETRTLYSPDILRGEDAYQHLPNILKRLGYYNIQYTHPHYVDAYTHNLLSSFEEANGKTLFSSSYQNWINEALKTDYAYFIYEVANRIIDRLRHIAFNKRMVTQQDLVMGQGVRFDDQTKVQRILDVIRASDRPVFAHLHWMGTHGSRFSPTHRVYSKEKTVYPQEMWDRDFYDDSILDFDSGVGEIITALKAMGVYEDTVLIVSSDHSQNYRTNQRIPLLIHFPGSQYQKRVAGNVQSMDIAPTVLEYLRVPKPAWMRGTSFLNAEPGSRPIIGVGIGETVEVKDGYVVEQTISPPFYQFGFITAVYCDRWYRLDLYSYRWETGLVAGHAGSCAGSAPVTDAAAFAWMRERLAEDGFDTSPLAEFPPVVQGGP